MKHPQPAARIFLILCLLVLQAHLFAASALACKHTKAGPWGETGTDCPLHHPKPPPQLGDSGGGELLDCHKCALHCAISIQGPVRSHLLELLECQVKEDYTGTLEQRFRSVPQSPFLRPPIFKSV